MDRHFAPKSLAAWNFHQLYIILELKVSPAIPFTLHKIHDQRVLHHKDRIIG